MSKDNKQSFSEFIKDAIALGKQVFAAEISAQKFADYKAEDGTIIRTDSEEIKVGSKLQVITPDGVADIPAEVTEVVLLINDVPTKVLIEGSVVKEIPAPAAADPAGNNPAEMQTMSSEEFNAKVGDLVKRITEIETKLGISTQALETANATIATANTQIAKQNELNKGLFSLMEKLADSPSVTPLSKAKEKFKAEDSHQKDISDFRKKHGI